MREKVLYVSQVLALYFPTQSFHRPRFAGRGLFKETIIMLTEKYTIEKANNGYILREECGVTVHLMDTTLYKELLGGLTETLNTTPNDKVNVTITIE